MNRDAVPDQVVDKAAARSLTADAARDHRLVAWVVVQDQRQQGVFIARLAADAPTPFVLRAETLAELRSQLPAGLVHSAQQPADPPDLVEIWFAR